MEAKVFDLDIFRPEPQEIKLGGKIFIIKLIPSGIALELYQFLPIMQELEKEGGEINLEQMNRVLNLIFKILNFVDPEIDKKWVEGNISFHMFNKLLIFIYGIAFSDGKKKETQEETEIAE